MRSLDSKLAFLVHPACLLALVLLIFNDRYLKAHWPGLISGKLSDFAGVFLLPAFLCANWVLFSGKLSLRIVVLAIALTDFVFVSVKVWPVATDFYLGLVAILGFPSHAVRDWTDLVALVMSLPAYWHLRRYINSAE